MGFSDTGLPDALGRRATYMRLSITDRCNLRCVYCVNRRRQHFIPHDRILRYEEFLRIIDIARGLGVQKIRITGGEPFARKGIMDFFAGIRQAFPDLRLCVTTNATLLAPYLADLRALEISSFNISLDSFDAVSFAELTGRRALGQVLDNIEALLALNQRIKINAVALRGITDRQMDDFLRAVFQYPIDVRFIEFMPMGSNTFWHEDKFISCGELLELAGRRALLREETGRDRLAGPAKMYSVAGARGRLGFISAVSEHFCAMCNRLRVTSEGALRLCLFSDREVRLAGLLRNYRIRDAHIARVMLAALRTKPLGRDLLALRRGSSVAAGQMVGIGG